jgi:dTDP-4-amino-4,6-dideoxygalactose transaminase
MLKKREIPFFNYPAVFAADSEEITQTINSVLARGAYIMQSELADFERELADFLGMKHAIGVGDGTMAMILPLLACKLEPGDEVIVPSHTFIASAAAIHHAGGTPVLVDCGPDHLIDAESARNAVTSRTRGIMPVQLNGRTANMTPILDLAQEHGLFIVEDSCQALGSTFKGQPAGSFGLAGAFSFYPSKTLGALGDGGAVVTNDDTIADAVKSLRDHGRMADGSVSNWGYNTRLDNVQAAVLSIKLRGYRDSIARRRELAGIYDARLAGIEQVLLPPGPSASGDHFDIYQNYEIEAESRDALREHLLQHGVHTILQWGGMGIHQFSDLGFDVSLPYTERMVERFMLLPMNTSLSDDDVNFVCDCVVDFYQD